MPPPLNLESIEEEKMESIPFKNLGAGNHWEKPKIANGEVIALPAAADIAP